MENYKYIDITQLPDDLWQDAKNLIALDSNGEVIKAAKQDSYTKAEIDDLLRDAEISADKLQSKIKINSASTDYIVTQPTVSGDSLVITDSISDKNQYHTFGYDKTITTTSNKLLDYSTPLFRGSNDYNCPQWDGNTIRFNYENGNSFNVFLTIPYTYNGVKYVTHFNIEFRDNMYMLRFGVINDSHFEDYKSVKFRESEVYKAFGANETFVFKKNNSIINYSILDYNINSTSDFVFLGDEIEMSIVNFPLNASNGALIIETPRFYIFSNNFLMGDVPTESQTYRHPERLNDYIRYSNDVKAYILTDKNTTFKTINGQQITGDGNIEISTDVDLSNYATKSELNTKQDVITDLDSIRSGAALGATALQSVPSEYATEQWVNEQGFLKEHQDISNLATKEELNTKQDVISDLDTIRSGAALGATALQSVPSGYATEQWVNSQGFLKEHQDISNLATKTELNAKQDVITDLETIRSGAEKGATALQSVPDTYALKSEIPDITTKQDKLVSGENIKTVNGTSLLGSGNIVIEASAANVPTLQTTVQGTTNNYIYSSGQNNKYGVISDFYTAISYEQGRASIHTDWYYWGNTDNYMVDGSAGWSIEGATTSQAGLMSASDKSKLDGIDLSTKQDTLVSGTNIKTINGNSLLGAGDITIEGGSGNVDLSDYYTKTETNALVNPKLSQVTLTQAEYDALSTKKENVLYIISDASNVDPSNLATKEELATKQDVISDLVTIRSGAALGATALQEVPSEYALKSEIPDISNKQDKLVSGSNIKTVNGTSLLGAGNIEVTSNVDLSGYYTKAEIDAMIGGASSTITEINNLVV